GAARLLPRFVLDPTALGSPLNLMRLLFDPRLARPFVLEWGRTAGALLARLHRESLARPSNAALGDLVRGLLEYPHVPASFRVPDLSVPIEPTLTLRLRKGELELAFLATVTVFSAPQNVTLEELRLESYFPLDEATARACERAAREEP